LAYLHRVYTRPLAGWERRLHRAPREQDWKAYALGARVPRVCWFGRCPWCCASRRFTRSDPLADDAPPRWDLTFNTTASFVTDTNWQN
jgi:K+-transporting ATPase A subunit